MKRIVLLCLLVVSVLPLKAQDMAAVFIAMPDEYVPQLEDAWRKDLVDLYRSNEKARLKNNMNGYSTLEKLTDNYLLLQSTERTTVAYIESTSRLDMDLFRFQLSPDDYTLTQTYTTPEYLDKETQKKLKPFLKDTPKVFTWKKSSFE